MKISNIAIALLSLSVIILGYKLYTDKQTEEILQSKYKQLSDNAALLEVKILDGKLMNAKLIDQWNKERSELQGHVIALTDEVFKTKAKVRKSIKSDFESNGYEFNEVKLNDSFPIGYCMRMKDGSYSTKPYDVETIIHTAIVEENGIYKVASKGELKLVSGYNKRTASKDWSKETHPLNIIGGTAYIDPSKSSQTPSFQFWCPKLGIGGNLSQDSVAANLMLSVLGYGKSSNDLSFKFLALGLQTNDFGVNVVPIYWRPFNFLSNTYIGAGANVNTKVTPFVGFNVSL